VIVDNETVNVVNVDSVNKGNPEQVLTSQVVGVVNVNEVYVDVDGRGTMRT
jgi:hypothetical protein